MDSNSSPSSTSLNAGMDAKRIVGIAYVVFALVGVLFFTSLIEGVFAALRWSNPVLLGVDQLSPASLTAFLVTAGIIVACCVNKRVYSGSLDIATELKRVTWPTLAETKVSTIAVIIVSAIASIILFGFDFISSKVMSDWIPALLTWVASA